jgi:seryl-tRNA synthetase
MLDIQFIRDNPELVKEKAAQKGYPVDITQLLELDSRRRDLLSEVEQLRQKRNQQSAYQNTQPTEEQISSGRELKESLTKLDDELAAITDQYMHLLLQVPNLPLEDVPVGTSELENKVTKTVGQPPTFDFTPKAHWQLDATKDLIDKERAAKIAGSRFAYIKGGLVELQFAVIQFVMSELSDERVIEKIIKDNQLTIVPKAFTPVLPPALVRTGPYEASARLNAEEVTYKLADDDLWLNASAEHSLCTMYIDEILPEELLPIRYVGYSTSFRREAGTYGKDTEGIIRMHQFDKLEMEVFSTPETGLHEHKLLIALQEHLVAQLGLPYQYLLKCTADIGKPNARGVDIETWFPGEGKYRETHTADYMTDYQARRLKTRTKRLDGRIEFVHTNDATAFALGRIMAAIVENNQTADGHVTIPEVLLPYMFGKERTQI